MGKKLTEPQYHMALLLGEGYADLKTARNRLNRERQAWVERQMATERHLFALDVLEAYEQRGMTVAQIGRAMGTSSRSTILKLVEEAREGVIK